MKEPAALHEGLHEKRRRFLARTARYLTLGYSRLGSVRHIVDCAGRLSGPALALGTGDGLLAMEIARRKIDVVNVNLNGEDAELARFNAGLEKLAARVRFVEEDARRLSFADGTFGCVAMMDVLHNMDSETAVLDEASRVLSEGGTLLLSDFNEEGFALVEKVHAAEGGRHRRGPVTMVRALPYLAGRGFETVFCGNGHLHDTAVLVKRT